MGEDLSGEWLKAIFTAAGLVITWAGIRLSKRGQDTSNREEKVAKEFDRLERLNQRLEAENARQRTELTDARALLREEQARSRQIQNEWEPRWARQMARCREMTESFARTVMHLQQQASSSKRKEAAETLHQWREHMAEDHMDLDGVDPSL